MLLVGRGRSYPALSVAVGERVGLIGALSVETAARSLNARDIDGIVIGDGFGPRVVEALLTVLAEDVRFRDLPVAVLGGHPADDRAVLPGCPISSAPPKDPSAWSSASCRSCALQAFGQRSSACSNRSTPTACSIPTPGCSANEAFWRDLDRAVEDAEKRGVGLSVARFSFDGMPTAALSLDAARLFSRLVRKSISPAARTTTRSSPSSPRPICARPMWSRAASPACSSTPCWRRTDRNAIDAAVTLATLKPTDNVDTLIARVVGEAARTMTACDDRVVAKANSRRLRTCG